MELRMKSNKPSIRKELKKRRIQITGERRKEASDRVFQQFSSLKGDVLSFASLKDEIDLWELNHFLAKQKRLIFPKIEKAGLTLFRVEEMATDLAISNWNLLEPLSEKCESIDPTKIQIVLVPGLGFDQNRHRIGYGKGHYDRLLPFLIHAYKIGVGFKEQFLSVPIKADSTDYPLDEICLF